MARILKILFVIVSMTLICFLAGCQHIESEELIGVTANVDAKNYKEEYTTLIPMRVGKVTVLTPQHHPAQYNVTISYEDVQVTFNDEELYNKVSVGEKIRVTLYLGYDSSGNLVKKELRLKLDECM